MTDNLQERENKDGEKIRGLTPTHALLQTKRPKTYMFQVPFQHLLILPTCSIRFLYNITPVLTAHTWSTIFFYQYLRQLHLINKYKEGLVLGTFPLGGGLTSQNTIEIIHSLTSVNCFQTICAFLKISICKWYLSKHFSPSMDDMSML